MKKKKQKISPNLQHLKANSKHKIINYDQSQSFKQEMFSKKSKTCCQSIAHSVLNRIVHIGVIEVLYQKTPEDPVCFLFFLSLLYTMKMYTKFHIGHIATWLRMVKFRVLNLGNFFIFSISIIQRLSFDFNSGQWPNSKAKLKFSESCISKREKFKFQ